jgi:hypothetical protein
MAIDRAAKLMFTLIISLGVEIRLSTEAWTHISILSGYLITEAIITGV